MSFVRKILPKISALLKAALGLVFFICVEYTVFALFLFLDIDYHVYEGVYNFVTCILVFITMFLIHKVSSSKKEPLIKIGKLSPDQVAALVIVALGMLGFVATYIGIIDKIAESKETVNQAVEDYRESVDRFAEIPQTVIPVWDSILYVVTLSFFVPVTEEMSFRGVVFGQLRREWGPWTSVILSALGFGILHGLTLHIGYAIVCGLIIATCYHLTDSLLAPIILHTIFNFFGSGIVTFLSIESFGIPEKFTSSLMLGINTASILFMPLSVIAMAYLVSVKRKKAKAESEAEDGAKAEKSVVRESDADEVRV